MNEAKIEKAPQPYTAKHITEKAAASPQTSKNRCSCPAEASRWYGHQEETIIANTENETAEVESISSDMASERRQPVQMAQFLQKEIDTQNMNIVVAQGSMRQFLRRSSSNNSSSCRPSRSSSGQHSKPSNLLRVKQIYIGVNKIDSDTAGSKLDKCDEISNQMKSMLIKICWTKDFH